MQLTRSCFRISDGVFEAFTVFFPPVTLRLRCDCFRDHHTCKVVSSSLQCISITRGSSRTSSSELQFTSPPSLKMIISTPVTFLPYLHWSLHIAEDVTMLAWSTTLLNSKWLTLWSSAPNHLSFHYRKIIRSLNDINYLGVF